jgi:hypothetical protein
VRKRSIANSRSRVVVEMPDQIDEERHRFHSPPYSAIEKRSPPASHALDPLDRFEEFFEHINRAARSVLSKISRRYSDAFVLLLRWEDDDLDTETELVNLEDIFQNIYHYNMERYLIPSRARSSCLMSRSSRQASGHASSESGRGWRKGLQVEAIRRWK